MVDAEHWEPCPQGDSPSVGRQKMDKSRRLEAPRQAFRCHAFQSLFTYWYCGAHGASLSVLHSPALARPACAWLGPAHGPSVLERGTGSNPCLPATTFQGVDSKALMPSSVMRPSLASSEPTLTSSTPNFSLTSGLRPPIHSDPEFESRMGRDARRVMPHVRSSELDGEPHFRQLEPSGRLVAGGGLPSTRGVINQPSPPHRAAGHAHGATVAAEAVGAAEVHAPPRQAVQRRRADVPVGVRADGVGAHVVGEEEQDVRPRRRPLEPLLRREPEDGDACGNEAGAEPSPWGRTRAVYTALSRPSGLSWSPPR